MPRNMSFPPRDKLLFCVPDCPTKVLLENRRFFSLSQWSRGRAVYSHLRIIGRVIPIMVAAVFSYTCTSRTCLGLAWECQMLEAVVTWLGSQGNQDITVVTSPMSRGGRSYCFRTTLRMVGEAPPPTGITEKQRPCLPRGGASSQRFRVPHLWTTKKGRSMVSEKNLHFLITFIFPLAWLSSGRCLNAVRSWDLLTVVSWRFLALSFGGIQPGSAVGPNSQCSQFLPRAQLEIVTLSVVQGRS